MNKFANDKPVLFFAITVSIFYTVFFISLDIFLAASESTSPPTLIRLKITGYILLWSLATMIGIKNRWKKIRKVEANQSSEPTLKTPADSVDV